MKFQPDKLPVLSWKDVVKVLQKLGYQYRHGRGSHMYFSDGTHNVTVPRHDEIAPKTLLSIIAQMGLAKEQFLRLL